jgi:heme-degrading monooxygenase HmoA
MDRHLAHFNWSALIAPPGIDDPRIAEFETAAPKVNALVERSPGFVWRHGDEAADARSIGWPLFTENPNVIASFSVWERPEDLRAFVYKTVHGAFYRRAEEWFEPGQGPTYLLWYIPRGHIPTIAEARARVDRYLSEGAGPEAFDFTYLGDAA